MEFGGRQKGMGLITFLLTVTLAVFVFVLILRLVPVVYESLQVQNTITSLDREVEFEQLSATEVVRTVYRRMQDDGVKSVRLQDISVIRESVGYLVVVEYAAQVRVIGNVSLLINFNKRARVL